MSKFLVELIPDDVARPFFVLGALMIAVGMPAAAIVNISRTIEYSAAMKAGLEQRCDDSTNRQILWVKPREAQ